jgi:hypothetical protein
MIFNHLTGLSRRVETGPEDDRAPHRAAGRAAPGTWWPRALTAWMAWPDERFVRDFLIVKNRIGIVIATAAP